MSRHSSKDFEDSYAHAPATSNAKRRALCPLPRRVPPGSLTPMNFEQILAYLQTHGWPVELLSENTARSRFAGSSRTFTFFVHSDGNYLTLLCVPYARLPADEPRARQLMDRVLHMNREMNMAKFSVDDDGDVVLSVDYPIAELQETEVRDTLDVLSYYADKHWEEVSRIASSAPASAP